MQIIIGICQFTAIYNHHSEIDAHLRSSQTAAVSHLQGIFHIVYKFQKRFLVIKVGFLVLITEHFRSIQINWQYHVLCCYFIYFVRSR